MSEFMEHLHQHWTDFPAAPDPRSDDVLNRIMSLDSDGRLHAINTLGRYAEWWEEFTGDGLGDEELECLAAHATNLYLLGVFDHTPIIAWAESNESDRLQDEIAQRRREGMLPTRRAE